MKTEKGVIIIAYKKPVDTPRYAVLKRKKNWEGWETPKGHLENDNYRETVKIELGEEVGIDESQILSIEDMNKVSEWTYEDDGEEFKKKYKAFLVRVSDDAHVDVTQNPCDEHEAGFFFKFSDTKECLTYEDNVELLEKAKDMIESQ